MLALDIELLTGVYRAALPNGSGPEWPPHPERMFSALVQAWADGGHQDDERRALEWLEQLAPPTIQAADIASPRDSATVYVPPNDFEIPQPTKPFEWPHDKAGNRKPIRDVGWAGIEPSIRAWSFRQARAFGAIIPEEDGVTVIWEVRRPDEMADPLDRLASRVSSIGHSSSLVRCTWTERPATNPKRHWRPDPSGAASLRVSYKGRLADLERWWEQAARPRSRAAVRYAPPHVSLSPAPASVFGEANDWFVFETADTRAPDILALAHITRRIRDALMKVGPQPAPPLLSGHAAHGGPSQDPHVAVLPLIDVGWAHSQGTLMGFAVVLPRDVAPDTRMAVMKAIAAFAPLSPTEDIPIAHLRLSRTVEWFLERSPAPSRASLRPGRWCVSRQTWASVTPVILDRFPDHDDALEEARIIAQSCRNIGLPEPEQIEIHKHSSIRGAPSAYFSRARGLSWTFPSDSKLANRPRRHVVLRFADSVTGPIVLGAGRYHGFGLCLPLDEGA